ncbi:MAG: cell wall hydrolase [Holosporales bacterium]|jgi:spore germination cell wall hydrolase CwlJ-like protein|nr:cell wall hydrolase [Holosporales bacterium]
MDRDIEIMAKTIYGEARGEYSCKNGGLKSLIAVGNVIMNRSKSSGDSITAVCLKPKQFSCWNKDDPNRKIIEKATAKDKAYQLCFITAAKIISEEIGDATNGANHYYSRFLENPPKWAKNKKPVAEIGNHIFFKL